MQKIIKFDSLGEEQCYQSIKKILPSAEIKLHPRYPLSHSPIGIQFEIDFLVETKKSIFFIEYKGYKASRGIWQLYRTKLAWFIQCYPDLLSQVPYFLVFPANTISLPNIPLVRVIRLNDLPRELLKLNN